MKKIPSLFKRNYKTHKIYDEITEGCEWVIEGEGTPTRKFDGTACMVENGKLYKRYDCKKGRMLPTNGFACEQVPDPVTGHWPWWIPVTKDDKYHKEAFMRMPTLMPNGTYELCGPKINGNPEGLTYHILIAHGCEVLQACPRTFDTILYFLVHNTIEGIVWHHPDGRMCKIKLRDFGIKRRGR